MPARTKKPKAPGAGKSPRPGAPSPKAPGSGKSPRPTPGKETLGTSKGTFTFQMVADGCYIEHKWGQNSGHVGVPLEAMPGFIEKMRTLYTKATVRANCLLAPASPFALPLLFLYCSRASSVFLLLFFLMLLLLLPLCGV